MRVGQRVEAVPAVGAGLEVEEYLEFLGKEYLTGFVRHGGAAVKVPVASDDDVAARFHAPVGPCPGARRLPPSRLGHGRLS